MAEQDDSCPPARGPETVALALDAHERAALSRLSDLSNRERAVFALVGAGLKSKAIGAALEISPRTVETHIERVRAKLGGEGRPLGPDDLAFLARVWRRSLPPA